MGSSNWTTINKSNTYILSTYCYKALLQGINGKKTDEKKVIFLYGAYSIIGR